jgi:hypothetical protein
MNSKDGFQWTEKDELTKGIPTIGLIRPSSNTTADNAVYDVIIIGAGYTALTAARDATTSGMLTIAHIPCSLNTVTTPWLRVLLLEARDRIGGRSWSSNIGGYPFEMGGTWFNWGQTHIWREISRYDMRKELEISQDYSHGVNHFSLFAAEGKKSNLSHEDEVCNSTVALHYWFLTCCKDRHTNSALRKFVNVDGNFGKTGDRASSSKGPFPLPPAYEIEIRVDSRSSVLRRTKC